MTCRSTRIGRNSSEPTTSCAAKYIERIISSERRAYVPSMHRNHSGNGRRSRIHGRNPGGVRQQVQKIFQSEWSRSGSENEGEIRWQQAKRKIKKTSKDISK